jgi:DNA sulfur modification protein DndD
MWISKLELNNFKSYVFQTFNFPQPENNGNLTLIGGMNGFGKTTLLEALYLCLYGADAMPHLGRAGLKPTEERKGYPTFLERAINGQAVGLGRDNMSVKVEALSSATEGFEITRRWFFTKRGDWNGEEEILLQEIKGGVSRPIDSFHLPELLDQRFVPAHLAPFFFFDGEEVKTLANRNRIEQIKTGMEGLLGVVLLRGVQKRLEQYQANNRYRNGNSTVDETKYKELADKLERDEQRLDELNGQKQEQERELEAAKAKRDDLMSRIMALGGGSGDIATAGDIVRQQGMVKSQLAECERHMEDALAGKLPFHLIHKDCTDLLKEQLRQEIRRRKWDTRKESMEPEKERFVASFFKAAEPSINPPLDDGQMDAVLGRLNVAWESLFYPPPSDCAAEIIHDYLSDDRRESVLAMTEKLNIGAQEIRTLVMKKENLQRELRELEKRWAKIDGVDRDGTFARINEELAGVSATIDQKERSRGDLERQIRSHEATIDQDRAVYSRMHEQIIKASPAKSNISKAQRVRELVEELIPCLYALKTKQLGTAMTRAYKLLAHKTQVDRIEIDQTGSSRLLAKDGTEINFDRSAGENQLFATALLAGLAEVSGIDAPLVVDTPLARLDSEHRKNILNFWTSQKKRQVILLAQDEEIDADMFNIIGASVCKSYLLEHSDLGRGVGRAKAIENQYFKER